jgi:phosphotransferase system  glucose/maltose/N-acetylglucosamine-specific IIC component
MIINFLGFSISIIWLIFILFLWITIALWPASIARQKGYSFFLWFILSLFFWWITLFVVMFGLKDKNVSTPSRTE